MTALLQSEPSASPLSQIIAIAKEIDPSVMAVEERANVAVTLFMETQDEAWSLKDQRAILADAVDALTAGDVTLSEAAAALPEPSHTTAPTPDTEPVQRTPVARPTKPQRAAPSSSSKILSAEMMKMSNEIVRDLSDVLDFSEVARQKRPEQERLIHNSIRALSEERKMHLNGLEIEELGRAVLADMLGLGPLEALLADPEVSDIMVNGADCIYVERGGKLDLTPARFRDNEHVRAVANRIVSAVGRRIDEAQPMVDARLADGSRVNIAIPPLAVDGTTITIRKFPSDPLHLETLVGKGALSAQMAGFLGLAAYLRLNILVSGGTGSGKTTLMNAMSRYIPAGERIITIEDAAELRFQQPHVVRFETRPPNVEGTGEVTMRTLVRNALRMRPDRIIIGEIRGDEVLDLLQAMNTGHDGSMSTLHANSPREALTRVESMAALAGFAPGASVVRRQLKDAVHLIVQVRRMRDGIRRITSISEIAGVEEDTITLQDLFSFEVDATSTRTDVRGTFRATGYRPKFSQRAADYGVSDELNALLKV